jgi:hypothetical protein
MKPAAHSSLFTIFILLTTFVSFSQNAFYDARKIVRWANLQDSSKQLQEADDILATAMTMTKNWER